MSNIQDKLLNVTKVLEKQVDAAIEQLDNLDVNDLEQLRKSRLSELKKLEAKRAEWLNNGHGQYEELPEEKTFFDVIKKSKNVVVHFFTNSSPRCAIVDMHLKLLAPKHIETRFVSLNAEKCPFLAENLKIKTIPSIVLVQDSVMVDKIVGFTQLGNTDTFSTQVLEWRIAQNNIIDYDGDLSVPPTDAEKADKKTYKKIRDGIFNDELDIEEEALPRESLSKSEVRCNSNFQLTAEEEAELGV